MSFYKGRKINGLQAHYIENKAAIAILYNYHSQENESSKQWLRIHKFKTFHLILNYWVYTEVWVLKVIFSTKVPPLKLELSV